MGGFLPYKMKQKSWNLSQVAHFLQPTAAAVALMVRPFSCLFPRSAKIKVSFPKMCLMLLLVNQQVVSRIVETKQTINSSII